MPLVYLLWGLLNIFLFLYLITICLKAVKLVRQEYGLFAACILVFGFLSFRNSSDEEKVPQQNVELINFTPKSQADTYYLFRNTDVVLEDVEMFKVTLLIQFGRDKKTLQPVPVNGSSYLLGFVSGIKWKPDFISVSHPDAKGSFKYKVYGMTEWRLLGATVYSDTKTYQGTASVVAQ